MEVLDMRGILLHDQVTRELSRGEPEWMVGWFIQLELCMDPDNQEEIEELADLYFWSTLQC